MVEHLTRLLADAAPLPRLEPRGPAVTLHEPRSRDVVPSAAELLEPRAPLVGPSRLRRGGLPALADAGTRESATLTLPDETSAHAPPIVAADRLLVVGNPDRRYGRFPVDYPSIGAAMDAIPTIRPDKGSFVDRFTILVLPGFYEEEVRLKPWVQLIGLEQDSVYITPPPGFRHTFGDGEGRQRRANVYLNWWSGIANVVLNAPPDATERDVFLWGFDRHFGSRGDIAFAGARNVLLNPGNTPIRTILMDGQWHTVFFRNVVSNFEPEHALGPTDIPRYGVQLVGRTPVATPFDCHIIDCFFDALHLEGTDCGCVLVEDCNDVHLRDCIARTHGPGDGSRRYALALGQERDPQPRLGADVALEGSTLDRRILVNLGSTLHVRHSYCDSVDHKGVVWVPDPSGIGEKLLPLP